MKASYQRYLLNFKRPSGTSRGVLNHKETWFLKLEHEGKWGIGECGLLRGLSADDRDDYEDKLRWLCDNIHLGKAELYEALFEFPSLQFGLEMAYRSFQAENPFLLHSSLFSEGKSSIPINGLIWMGDKPYMKEQMLQRLNDGFKCIKMKIGAIDFTTELELLKAVREEFSSEEIEVRVDANGAFAPHEALEKLKRLADLNLHSIEQPIKAGQWEEMALLCDQTPLPIALDEELIGLFSESEKINMLKTIQPQYIILKPSFIGGYQGCDFWIDLAESHRIGWWITSALESNIGLNAISQYTFTKNSKLPQGLGTGSLYTNNIPAPLIVSQGFLSYQPNINWDLSPLEL